MNTSHQLSVRENSVSSRRRGIERLLRDRRGANFAEYLVLIAAVALLGMGIFSTFRTNLQKAGGDAGTKVQGIINGGK